MMAYNSAPTIEFALKGIEPHAYQIVIVEGAWLPKEDGRSTDGTIEIIEQFRTDNPDKTEIIHFDAENIDIDFPGNQTYNTVALANQLKARQMGYDICHGDFFFIVDSDEVYFDRDLRNLTSYLYNMGTVSDDILQIRVPAYVFYFSPQFCTKEYFTRIYSNHKKGKFTHDNTIEFDEPTVKMDIDKSLLLMFHYGYVNTDIKSKLEKWDSVAGEKWYNEVYLPALETGPKKDINYHLFAEKLGYGGKFFPYRGPHPEVIRAFIQGD